jgi:Kef-type K+ transport system membrane component KefB
VTNFQIGIHLFLQLAVIILSCRAIGWLGRRFFSQSQVFMEMAVGVMLGPSLLGVLAPGVQEWLFPRQLLVEGAQAGGAVLVAHPNMTILYALAQIGLVLYMFVIGLEFDLGMLRGRLKGVAYVSGVGVLAPFLLAAALMPILLARDDLFAPASSRGVAFLFVGAALAITAFPMLARMLFESGLSKTGVGALTIASGAIDDAIAWCLLAFVLSMFRAAPELFWLTVLGGIGYGAVVLTLGRRFLRALGARVTTDGVLSLDVMGYVLALLAVCAFFTDFVGIYAVFGAFILGAAMPKGALATQLIARIEPLTTSLLLPMFFVYSGLNTKIGLVDSLELWMLAGIVTLVAIVAKGVACALAARGAGESWTNAALVGSLMNARGLMELILLNIGLERGVITPTFFAIMVIMTVLTTGMASPLVYGLSRIARRQEAALAAPLGAPVATGVATP